MRVNKIPVVIIIQILLFAGGTFTYARPQPDFTLWGTAYVNGAALTHEDIGYNITLEVQGKELVRYRMGETPAYGDYYVLKIPMDDDPAVAGKGQPGDDAFIYINGNAVNESPLTLGKFGETVEKDIHASFIVFEPESHVYPAALDFGEVLTGSLSSLRLTISNTGTADLNVKNIGLIEGSSADFSIISGLSDMILIRGAEVTVEVVYSPSDEGADGGIVEIHVNDKTKPVIAVPLSGKGYL